MEIPEPSEADWAEKDTESFLSDPEQLWDPLPQPYRTIDKLLQGVLDAAWDAILRRQEVRRARPTPQTHPTLTLTAHTQLPESTHCLACSGDGRFLAVGHAQGLTVSHASSLACVCSWPPEGGTEAEITAIQMRAVGHGAYLLCAVDDMGVASVLAFNAEQLHVLKIINKTDDINRRSVCVTFELSEGGDFAAAFMRCNGAVWLDVYHFPLEAWLEDLKQAEAHSQKPTGGDVRWTPCSVLMKITPPKQPTGTTLLSPLELLKRAEPGGGLGSSGLNHMISGRQWGLQDAAFRSRYGFEPWDHQDVQPGLGAAHFLSPCDVPAGSTGEGTAPPGALCLWWRGSQNLLQYPLGKARNKQDAEHRAAAAAPSFTWPNAQEIVCSAVSRDHRYLALGLGPEHAISVWDRQTASPLSVVGVSVADSPLTHVVFVESAVAFPQDAPPPGPAPWAPEAPPVHLVVSCRSGSAHTLTAGTSVGLDHAHTLLSPRPTDAGRGPTAIAPLAFLRGLTLVLPGNGEMLVVDSVRGATLCRLKPPTTAAPLAWSSWAPVYALDPVRQTLFIRGDTLTSQRAAAARTEGSPSRLLVLRCGEHPLFEPRAVGDPGVPPGPAADTLEQACNRYLRQRSPLAGREGSRAGSDLWPQLQQESA